MGYQHVSANIQLIKHSETLNNKINSFVFNVFQNQRGAQRWKGSNHSKIPLKVI